VFGGHVDFGMCGSATRRWGEGTAIFIIIIFSYNIMMRTRAIYGYWVGTYNNNIITAILF